MYAAACCRNVYVDLLNPVDMYIGFCQLLRHTHMTERSSFSSQCLWRTSIQRVRAARHPRRCCPCFHDHSRGEVFWRWAKSRNIWPCLIVSFDNFGHPKVFFGLYWCCVGKLNDAEAEHGEILNFTFWDRTMGTLDAQIHRSGEGFFDSLLLRWSARYEARSTVLFTIAVLLLLLGWVSWSHSGSAYRVKVFLGCFGHICCINPVLEAKLSFSGFVGCNGWWADVFTLYTY